MKKLKFTFSHRIIASFAIMAILSILIGCLAFMTTGNLQKISSAIMKENVSGLKAAEELEIAVLNQKGLASNYFLDGNIAWLKMLEEKRKDFDTWFDNAKNVALTAEEKRILRDIYNLYRVYDSQRNKAIKLYQSGNVAEGRRILLGEMQNSIDSLYDKCEDLLLVNETLIAKAEAVSQKNAFVMILVIWTTIIGTLCLGGFMGFLTSRKINDELIRSARMASLGQLSANVAHEIRNPLTSIKMRLYTLQGGLKDERGFKDDMNVINEEINRLERIVKHFLDFARPPALKLQVCGIGEILKGVIDLLEPKALANNVRIERQIDAGLPAIEIDREQMKQVFLNVMLNAIEAMPNGGSIQLAASFNNRDEKPNEMLEVCVKDTGIGIDPAFKNRLFEPFVTTKEQGTGLGLFIASRIIKLHHGSMRIDSQLNGGTIVIVALPVSSKKVEHQKYTETLRV